MHFTNVCGGTAGSKKNTVQFGTQVPTLSWKLPPLTRGKKGHGSGMRKGQCDCDCDRQQCDCNCDCDRQQCDCVCDRRQWHCDCDRQQMRLFTLSAYFCPEYGSSRLLSTKLHGVMYQKLAGVRTVSEPKAPDTTLSQFGPIHALSIQCTALRAISFFNSQAAAFQTTSPPNQCKILMSQRAQ